MNLKICNVPKGPFKSYVDKILTIFDYLPTSTWTFFTLNVDKKKHFLTTYLPHLFHVVFERPPRLYIYIPLGLNTLVFVQRKSHIHQNLFKYWVTLWQFAMDDPVPYDFCFDCKEQFFLLEIKSSSQYSLCLWNFHARKNAENFTEVNFLLAVIKKVQ